MDSLGLGVCPEVSGMMMVLRRISQPVMQRLQMLTALVLEILSLSLSGSVGRLWYWAAHTLEILLRCPLWVQWVVPSILLSYEGRVF